MPDSLSELADQCVMCGLCLPHCPTFAVSGNEAHSPRGRIALAKRLDAGAPLDASTVEALDSCLQCRRCEAVCPAGVRYGEIIERTARRLPASRLPWRLRLVRRMVRYPGALARGLAVARALRLAATGRTSRWLERARWPLAMSADDAAPQLFVGCVARTLETTAQQAVLAIAARLGEPMVPADMPCCGALDRHLGFDPPQQGPSRRLVALDTGCIGSLRNAGHAVDEWCAWMLSQASQWRTRIVPAATRVALWIPCTAPPAAVGDLLTAIGVTYSLVAGFGCCGAAGPNLLSHTDMADRLAMPIVDELQSLNVAALVTTNVGCAQHLRERLLARGVDLPVRHPAELFLERLH